jgi:hypothetical protein
MQIRIKNRKLETVSLEDVKTILQTHEGETLYPIMISNIIREIRKRDQEQKNKGI